LGLLLFENGWAVVNPNNPAIWGWFIQPSYFSQFLVILGLVAPMNDRKTMRK